MAELKETADAPPPKRGKEEEEKILIKIQDGFGLSVAEAAACPVVC